MKFVTGSLRLSDRHVLIYIQLQSKSSISVHSYYPYASVVARRWGGGGWWWGAAVVGGSEFFATFENICVAP